MFHKTHWVAVAQTVPVVALATLVVAGASWGLDWSTAGTVKKAHAAGMTAGARAEIVPYCTEQMVTSKDATDQLKAKTSTWERRSLVEKLAKTPAGKSINSDDAGACAESAYEKINAAAKKT